MTLRRTLSAACLTLACLALVAVPAHAAPGDAVATGSAGAVDLRDGGVPVTVAPIAPCASDGTTQAAVDDVTVEGVVSFTRGRSTCAVDAAGEVARATVSGGAFRFDGLREHGGPRIRLADYTAECATTVAGSTSSVRFTGLSGLTVPSELPSNHVVTVPGADGKPIATVTFNEFITPTPADGSQTVHLMHVRMFPQGGPASGDVYVGTVHCAPM